MIENLFLELSKLSAVEAIALGGSRAGSVYDEKSDYDIYLYCKEDIPEEARKQILKKYCSRMEIGNHFWEYEDNCTLNNGIDIDILYRNLDDFVLDLSNVVEKFQARNGYTTCMWHNFNTCKIIYDSQGRLASFKKRFNVAYPLQLKKNIIDRNMKLLYSAMPAYEGQILKAVLRDDWISINHRVTAFMESYFDILFAVNELTHPGEKRLISYCQKNCKLLPNHFEENLNTLFLDLYHHKEKISADLKQIIKELVPFVC